MSLRVRFAALSGGLGVKPRPTRARGDVVVTVRGRVVGLFSVFYHGADRKQCWRGPNCAVCYVKTFFAIVQVKRRLEPVSWRSQRGHPGPDAQVSAGK